MAITDINSEDRLVSRPPRRNIWKRCWDWDSVYAWNQKRFSTDGTLGRADTRGGRINATCAALVKLNPGLPAKAIDDAVGALKPLRLLPLVDPAHRNHRLIRDGITGQRH